MDQYRAPQSDLISPPNEPIELSSWQLKPWPIYLFDLLLVLPRVWFIVIGFLSLLFNKIPTDLIGPMYVEVLLQTALVVLGVWSNYALWRRQVNSWRVVTCYNWVAVFSIVNSFAFCWIIRSNQSPNILYIICIASYFLRPGWIAIYYHLARELRESSQNIDGAPME